MFGHPLLDLLDGDPPVVGPQQIVQDVLCGLQRHGPAHQGPVSDDAVECAFHLADVRGDLVGQEFQDLEGNLRAQLFAFGLQDAQAQLVGGGMDVGDQTPAQPRAHALLDALQVRRALVRRDHHLAVLVDQGVEGVKELLLRRLPATDELHVIDHQHVHGAELFLEGHGVLGPQRTDELVHEFFGRQIDHLAARRALADLPGNGMHEMSLAEPDPAIEKQGIERYRVGLGHAPCRRIGQLVRLADDEILEGEAQVERRADVVAGRVDHIAAWLGLTRPQPGIRGGLLAGAVACARFGIEPVRPRARPLRHLHHDFDPPDLLVLFDPQQANAVGIIALHPIAHETGRNRHPHGAAGCTDERERLEPASESGLTHFAAQPSAHARPALLHQGIDIAAIHASPLGVAAHRGPRVHLEPLLRSRSPVLRSRPSFEGNNCGGHIVPIPNPERCYEQLLFVFERPEVRQLRSCHKFRSLGPAAF